MMNNSKLKSLQALRALAALSVVYFHIKTEFIFGSFGVDIFFVISGYVMALVVANGQRPLDFAISRLIRVVPLYWILTTGVFLLAILRPDLLNSTTADFGNYIKSLLFVPYFKENGALHPMLAVGWTLNYEMFFYFCVFVAIAIYRKYYFALIGGGWVVLYFGVAKLSSIPEAQEFFGSSLIFEFLLGILVYWIHSKKIAANCHWRVYIAAAATAYCFMGMVEYSEVNIDRIIIYGVPSFILVFSVIGLELSCFRVDFFGRRLVTIIGDSSYAIYLSHFYVVEGVRKILHQKYDIIDPCSIFGVSFIVLLSMLVGYVAYVVVDKPITDSLRKKIMYGR